MTGLANAIVDRTSAERDPTRHQLVRGVGYLAHIGPPDLPSAARGDKNCAPAGDAADGSLHALRAPTGQQTIEMRWLARHGAWAAKVHGQGNRLAWTPVHLSRAGWEYVGPVGAKEKPSGKPGAKRLVQKSNSR